NLGLQGTKHELNLEMAWQSEQILICIDDHIITLPSPSGSAPMRFTHTGIPCASTNRTSPIQSTPHKCFTHLWGPSNRGQPTWGSFIQFYRHASDDLTASHPISDTICCEGRA